MKFIIHFLTVFYLIHQVKPQSARSEAGCAFLNQKIYCFGGTYGPDAYNGTGKRDSLVYSLDPSIGGTAEQMATQWKLENVVSNLNLEPRSEFQSAAISNTQLLISGGSGGTTGTRLTVQTILFDAVNHSLTAYASYEENSNENRQIYCASSVNVPGKGVAFFGGIEAHAYPNWTVDGRNVVGLTLQDGYDQSTARFVGYTAVTYFNSTNNVWITPNQVLPSTTQFMLQQASFLYSNKIYYLGGINNLNGTTGNFTTYNSMSIAPTFDTVTSIWDTQTLNGTIPSVRTMFTATLLPNGSNKVLVYGGESVALVEDYCYILDMSTFTWNPQILGPSSVLYKRSRQSVVLLNDDILFIVMGLYATLEATATPIILDISNTSSIKYLSAYTYTPIPSVATHQQSGLSSGAIAGISVACAIAGILVLAGLFFWLRYRQRKQEVDTLENKFSPSANGSQVDHVNWDDLERYEERPMTALYSPVEDTGTTLLSDNMSEKPNMQTKHIETNRVVKPDGADFN